MKVTDLNNVFRDRAITVLILPRIKTYMEAGYNFQNAMERVLYLEDRKRRIKHQNVHQE